MAAPRKLDLVPLAEAAEHLRVSTKTLRRWIRDGRLTGYRTGPALIRVDRVELDALARPIDAA